MKNNIIEKCDLKPIWIYFIGIFCLASFLIIVFTIVGLNEDYINLTQIISEGLVFFIFIIIYRERLRNDFKRLNIKNILLIIISSIILIFFNNILSTIFEKLNVNMNNQDTLTNLFINYKIITSLLIVLFGPLVEEMVFRYSFKTFIKNDILYLIISSLAFGIMHGVSVATILYFLLGLGIGLVYLKINKNIVASTSVHMLNNLVALIQMLLI